MKTRLTMLTGALMLMMISSCTSYKCINHTVRMVDAKSYMDHPPSAGIYYYK